ncbi:MAG: sulfatase [Thermoanaerobaculia bacterium]
MKTKPREQRIPRRLPTRSCILSTLLAALAPVLTCGCNPGHPREISAASAAPPQAVVWRAISDDPATLDRGPAFAEESLRSWNFPDAGTPADPSTNPPLAEVALAVSAATLQLVTARVENLPAGTLSLWWRTDQEDYSPAASIQIQMERSRAPQGTARFDVVDSPQWRGEIRGLRLYTEQRKRAQVRARGLELFRRVPRSGEIARLVSTPWKLALGQDLRNGFLLLPAHPQRFEVDVPAAAQLRFSWGLEGGLRSGFPIDVEVTALDGSAPPATTRIEAKPSATAPEWHDAAVDLKAWGGRHVGISIRSRSEDPAVAYDPAAGFPLLANPRVVAVRAQKAPWNVILISIDTLRADHLSAYGYSRATTPHLDAWARRQATVFDNAIAAAPSTLPSHASMLTGVEAFRHGAQNDPLAPSWRTLAEELRAAGYTTWGVTGGAYTSPAMGLAQGFDVYRSWVWGFERGQELPTNMDWTLAELARQPAQPFFLFFHTYEVHAPLRAREPEFSGWNREERRDSLVWVGAPTQEAATGYRLQHAARFEYRASDPSAPAEGPATLQSAIDRYDSSIAYVDRQLERLFRELESDGLAANTLIVLTSDHGESFGEHDLAGHGYLYDDNLHVPLFVSVPGSQDGGKRVLHQVRSIDITPTILDLAIGSSIAQADGSSLRPLLADPSAPFPDDAWSYAANSGFGLSLRLQGRLKYWLFDSALHSELPAEQVFDLRSDPAETKTVALSDASVAALRAQASERLARDGSGMHIDVENRLSTSATVTIHATGLQPLRLTAAALPAPAGEWRDGESARFTLAAGSRLALILQTAARSPVDVSVDPQPGLHVRPLRIDRPGAAAITYSLVGDNWIGTPHPDTRIRVTARSVGADSMPPTVTSRSESELEAQLRALGYLH